MTFFWPQYHFIEDVPDEDLAETYLLLCWPDRL